MRVLVKYVITYYCVLWVTVSLSTKVTDLYLVQFWEIIIIYFTNPLIPERRFTWNQNGFNKSHYNYYVNNDDSFEFMSESLLPCVVWNESHWSCGFFHAFSKKLSHKIKDPLAVEVLMRIWPLFTAGSRLMHVMHPFSTASLFSVAFFFSLVPNMVLASETLILLSISISFFAVLACFCCFLPCLLSTPCNDQLFLQLSYLWHLNK